MAPPDAHQLGRLVQRERDAHGLTLRELASRTGLDHTYIFRVEQGEIATPAPDKLQRLARALEIEVEDLYALAGYAISDRLPEFAPYLRAKYDLPDQAVSQLDEYFRLLREKYGSEGGENG